VFDFACLLIFDLSMVAILLLFEYDVEWDDTVHEDDNEIKAVGSS
jgi:hypothetical protein